MKQYMASSTLLKLFSVACTLTKRKIKSESNWKENVFQTKELI